MDKVGTVIGFVFCVVKSREERGVIAKQKI